MMYNTKESTLTLNNMHFDYITFGKGTKPLIMIQGLNTRGIKGAGLSLAYMYRLFAKDYKVYLFDRRPIIEKSITVEDMAKRSIAIAISLAISSTVILFSIIGLLSNK